MHFLIVDLRGANRILETNGMHFNRRARIEASIPNVLGPQTLQFWQNIATLDLGYTPFRVRCNGRTLLEHNTYTKNHT